MWRLGWPRFCNIIRDNLKGGLAVIQKVETLEPSPFAVAALIDPLLVDARGNWWGDATGPFHASKNATGLGNQVVDASNGVSGTGDVQFNPWIDAIVGTASPDPTAVGVPTAIHFQLSDDPTSPTYFLGRGVGNLNDTGPFTVTAQGGTLQGASGSGQTIHEFITTDDGQVLATLIPSAEGLTQDGYAVVTLQGPCMPDRLIRIPVLQPGIHAQKTPDLQVVPAGADVTFSIEISNTGDLTLTQVAVADALAPACALAAGAIPDLAPHTGYSYQCAQPGVAAGFVNEAVASATTQIGIDTLTAAVAANGAPQVVATDTAQVQVASIVLTKTVSAAPAACRPTNVITMTLSESTPQANVIYCYTVENTGEVSLDTHDLVDDPLGQLLDDAAYSLVPGSTFAITATAALTATTVNTATWTGFYGPSQSVSASDGSSARVVVIQAPTALPKTEQPLGPGRVFLPLITQ